MSAGMSFWRRPYVLWTAEVLLFLICCVAAWRLVEDRVTQRDSYIVSLDEFIVTRRPAWIQSDVKRQVLQNASLDGGVSLLDDDLVRRVAEAFPMHPWVAGVTQVRKSHPARVEVDVVYREPVAMVTVPGGLYAVDVYGVLLPSDDFTADEAARYPRIEGIAVPPADEVGDPWGDPQVEGAARLAALMQGNWSSLQLAWIVPATNSTSASPVFDIVTQTGGRIVWGPAPALEAINPDASDARLSRLVDMAKEHGSLDAAGQSSPGSPVIDLTRAQTGASWK